MAETGISVWIAVVALIFGAGSAVVAGIISWTKKMGGQEGKQSVTTTVIENIIKQIEDIKREIEIIRRELVGGNIQQTRLEERLSYLQNRLSELIEKIDRLSRDSRERYERDHP